MAIAIAMAPHAARRRRLTTPSALRAGLRAGLAARVPRRRPPRVPASLRSPRSRARHGGQPAGAGRSRHFQRHALRRPGARWLHRRRLLAARSGARGQPAPRRGRRDARQRRVRADPERRRRRRVAQGPRRHAPVDHPGHRVGAHHHPHGIAGARLDLRPARAGGQLHLAHAARPHAARRARAESVLRHRRRLPAHARRDAGADRRAADQLRGLGRRRRLAHLHQRGDETGGDRGQPGADRRRTRAARQQHDRRQRLRARQHRHRQRRRHRDLRPDRPLPLAHRLGHRLEHLRQQRQFERRRHPYRRGRASGDRAGRRCQHQRRRTAADREQQRAARRRHLHRRTGGLAAAGDAAGGAVAPGAEPGRARRRWPPRGGTTEPGRQRAGRQPRRQRRRWRGRPRRRATEHAGARGAVVQRRDALRRRRFERRRGHAADERVELRQQRPVRRGRRNHGLHRPDAVQQLPRHRGRRRQRARGRRHQQPQQRLQRRLRAGGRQLRRVRRQPAAGRRRALHRRLLYLHPAAAQARLLRRPLPHRGLRHRLGAEGCGGDQRLPRPARRALVEARAAGRRRRLRGRRHAVRGGAPAPRGAGAQPRGPYTASPASPSTTFCRSRGRSPACQSGTSWRTR
jgi:hypothetical protein